jgi:dTDP-4-dehydrorhamnose 3,5-epimerase-like enzyme
MGRIIETRDPQGKTNGWLMPLWNVEERPDLQPAQVYLTVVAPGCSKGPHLHKIREQRYHCIKGAVIIVTRDEKTGEYSTAYLWQGDRLIVKAGTPSQLINNSDAESWIINMPTPAWTPGNRDEWPVDDWELP